jgi:hypothetical protein
METFGNQIQPNSAFRFYCKYCDYGSSKKCNFETHVFSLRHSRNIEKETNGNDIQPIQPKFSSHDYLCNNCNKDFKNRSGLWKHKKKCLHISEQTKTESEAKELIQFLMKENTEFKQLILDQNNQMMELSQQNNKQIFELAQSTGNNNTINSNNSFNINIYLNETCKNAMNIMDFVNQLQVGIKDLEETGRLGFSEGISKIFINGLKQIDITDRPVHCSDLKRETLYIKNNDQWNKDNEDKSLLTNAIKHVAHKNMKQISEWTKEHPEYNDSQSKQNDKYLKIVSESMSGSTLEETNKNYTKIIKNIVKETVIDK